MSSSSSSRIAFGLIVVVMVGLCVYAQERTYAKPQMISSQNGHLNVDLTAAPATYAIDGQQFQGMLYNGEYMPAVWRLRSGDTLTVTLSATRRRPERLMFFLVKQKNPREFLSPTAHVSRIGKSFCAEM